MEGSDCEMGDEDDLFKSASSEKKTKKQFKRASGPKKGTAGLGKEKQAEAQGDSESGSCVEEDTEDKQSQSWAFLKKNRNKYYSVGKIKLFLQKTKNSKSVKIED